MQKRDEKNKSNPRRVPNQHPHRYVQKCMPESREGVNREKLTVKKLIDNEMFFFFTVYVPYKP